MLAGHCLVSPCPYIPQHYSAHAIEHLLPLIQAWPLEPGAAPDCLLHTNWLFGVCFYYASILWDTKYCRHTVSC